MAYATKEKQQAYQRAYRLKNKEKVNSWTRDHYWKHKDEKTYKINRKKTFVKWYYGNRNRIREAYRIKWLSWRDDIINIMGGKCVRCGFDDRRALQIDHVNGDGHLQRKGQGGNGAWLRIRKEIKSGINKELYQLLCANCNWIKRYENNETSNKFAKDNNHDIPDVPHKYLTYER